MSKDHEFNGQNNESLMVFLDKVWKVSQVPFKIVTSFTRRHKTKVSLSNSLTEKKLPVPST